jgi:hypothetical protein
MVQLIDVRRDTPKASLEQLLLLMVPFAHPHRDMPIKENGVA